MIIVKLNIKWYWVKYNLMDNPIYLFLASSWDISSLWALLVSKLKFSSVGLLALKEKKICIKNPIQEIKYIHVTITDNK